MKQRSDKKEDLSSGALKSFKKRIKQAPILNFWNWGVSSIRSTIAKNWSQIKILKKHSFWNKWVTNRWKQQCLVIRQINWDQQHLKYIVNAHFEMRLGWMVHGGREAAWNNPLWLQAAPITSLLCRAETKSPRFPRAKMGNHCLEGLE